MKYEEMLRQAVGTEMNEGCHDDTLEDYNDAYSFYSSNAEMEEYPAYLAERFGIDKSDAAALQEDVLEQIEKECEALDRLAAMKLENGSAQFEGRNYILTQQAYLDYDPQRDEYYYTASAICEDDSTDEDNWRPCYRITWAVIADDEDASNNANWDCPEDVIPCGEYNEEDGRIC